MVMPLQPFSDWVKQAKAAHGNKYDYSKTKADWGPSKKIVTCKEHGDFVTNKGEHKRVCSPGKTSGGCHHCSGKRLSRKDRIQRVCNLHEDRYDYSLLPKQFTSLDKVRIRCIEHNFVFEQLWGNHGRGAGCHKCSGKYQRTHEEFMALAKEAHGDKYDYRLAHFFSVDSKVTIICPHHGKFEQSDGGHISGQGCRECGDETNESYRQEPFKWGRRTVRLQGYEPQALLYLKSLGYKPSSVLVSVSEGVPIVPYEYEGQRTYRPDFFIPSENTVIEVKSGYTWQKQSAKNKAKLNAARERYNVWLLIMNQDGTVHQSVRKPHL